MHHGKCGKNMSNITLLDCTLRDGGYINDWEFGHSNLISVFERVVNSGTEIIEVGFIDDRRPYDYNRSIFPNTESIRKIYESVKCRPSMVVAMIDYGTCDISNIEPCNDSFIDGIRVIFKKHRMVEAMEYCRQLKQLGYKVFSQLVSITSYDDDELLELVRIVNDVKPYAVSIVDTYGLLHPLNLLHYYEILENNVDSEIGIGFHAHNNLQLAYANAITFVDQALRYEEGGQTREVIVDGTLYGIGKSAGNAPLELLGRYINSSIGNRYDISCMLEAIEETVKDIYIKAPWGYKTNFYLSSENKCHPSYVTYFQNKGNLSVSKMDKLLSMIEPEEKKLLYDKDLAERIYRKYINEDLNDNADIERLSGELENRDILIVGPGKNIKLQTHKVTDYISSNNPIIISINYIPGIIRTDFVFVTKVNRYQQMTDKLHEEHNSNVKIICTTNVECDESRVLCTVNREPLLELKEEICDNSFLMLMKILKRAGVKKVSLAGLDGYSDKEDNYFEPGMEYGFIKLAAKRLNYQIREKLATEYSDMELNFITYSHYLENEDANSGAF